jgi:hypothetical protein
MVTDALLAPLLALAQWVVDTLPDGQALALPSLDGVWSAMAGLNSLLPVSEVVIAALGLLSLVVVFLAVRLVLVLWNLVWP